MNGTVPGGKPYRDRLRAELAEAGVTGACLTDQVAADPARHGMRPRQAWQYASELSQRVAAMRFNEVTGDPRAPMTGNRIWDFERWPDGGVRPTVRTLTILARIYGTTWDLLVDATDLARMPPADRDAYAEAATSRARAADSGAPPRPVPGAGEDHPLGRRRMLPQVELAGLSCSCISMIERGHRTLTRLDHINSVASALRVSPAELAPGVVPGRGERTPAPQVPVAAFSVVRDEITVTRYAHLTREFMIHVARGDINATGMWLRRTVRDPDVNPWLLLDQLSARPAEPDATAIRRQFRTGAGWMTT